MRRTAALVAMLSLTACSMEPPLPPSPLPVPPSWPAGDPYLVRNEAPLPAVTYREIFRDPRLQQLIVEALANNRDLRVAAANIAAARAQVRITRANQFPELDAAGKATVTGGADSYSLGLSIPSFEIDLFGRRKVFIAGVVIFALSSGAIGFSPNPRGGCGFP